MDFADNHRSFRLRLPLIRKEPWRRKLSSKSSAAQHGKDVESGGGGGGQKFVELPARTSSPFYHLADYRDDCMEVRAAAGRGPMLACGSGSDATAAAAG